MKYRLSILAIMCAFILSACSFSLSEDITPPPDYQSPTPPPTVGPLVPPSALNPEKGMAIYIEQCAPCHGESGMGDGSQGKQLEVSVPALGLPEIARSAIPADWFLVVTKGNIYRSMPSFNILNDQERWDVVAYALTLSTLPDQITAGKELYASNCALCHGEDGRDSPGVDLTNQARMAKLSANDFYHIMSSGNQPDMPSFETTLSQAERWALAAYLRQLTFAVVEPVSTPQLPSSATQTVVETPIINTQTPDAILETTPTAITTPAQVEATSNTNITLEPAATTEGNGMIKGVLTNGTGEPIQPGLTITLKGYDQDPSSGGFQEILSLTTTVMEDGSFRFADVEMPTGRAFIASIEYGPIEYQSDPVFVTEGINQFELPITIYETTTDTSSLTVDRWHIFLDFSKKDTIEIIEVFVISNSSSKTVVPDNGKPVTTFALPEGYTNLQFEDGKLGERFIQTSDGFGDSAVVLPGTGEHQLIFAYDLPYRRKLNFSQPTHLVIDSVIVMAPEGVTIKSDMLENTGIRDFQGTPYTFYSGQSISNSDILKMTISGKPKTTTQKTEGTNSQGGLFIGIGAFGVVLIIAGIWMYLRDRSRVDQGENELGEDDELDTTDSIMDAIIALDDLYRSGELPEDAYHKQRNELKDRLKELL